MVPIDIAAAIACQQELRERVILSGDLSGADLIAGADTSSRAMASIAPTGEPRVRPSFHRQPAAADGTLEETADRGGSATDNTIHAAIVVWSLSQTRVIAAAMASLPVTFPYIPGLLAFREIPSLLEAWSKLFVKPDVIICDGHGIAHPRRCGIACHIGVELGIASIGCGKSRLIGRHEEPGPQKGDWTDLYDQPHSNSKIDLPNSKIGRVVRTRRGVAPVFVSVGHMCDIEGATGLTLRATTRFRLPEPIRAAHLAAGNALRNVQQ